MEKMKGGENIYWIKMACGFWCECVVGFLFGSVWLVGLLQCFHQGGLRFCLFGASKIKRQTQSTTLLRKFSGIGCCTG